MTVSMARHVFTAAFLLAAVSLGQTIPALATIHDFTGYPVDGANPMGPVVMDQQGEGALVGTTSVGGTLGAGNGVGHGTIFFFTPSEKPGGPSGRAISQPDRLNWRKLSRGRHAWRRRFNLRHDNSPSRKCFQSNPPYRDRSRNA